MSDSLPEATMTERHIMAIRTACEVGDANGMHETFPAQKRHLREVESLVRGLVSGELVVVPRSEIEKLQREAGEVGNHTPMGGYFYRFMIDLHKTLSGWLSPSPSTEHSKP